LASPGHDPESNTMSLKTAPRRIEIAAPRSSDHKPSFLPSKLIVVRPDGTCERDPALLDGHSSYTYWLTDETLEREVERGTRQAVIDWITEETDQGVGYRAAGIKFPSTDAEMQDA